MPAFIVPDSLSPLHSKPVDTVSVMYIQSLGLDIGTPIMVNADGIAYSTPSLLFYTDMKIRRGNLE